MRVAVTSVVYGRRPRHDYDSAQRNSAQDSAVSCGATVGLSTLFMAPTVFAQSTTQSNPTPGQADFDACNKQAEAQAGTPSAAARQRTGPMITGPATPETGAQGGPAPSSSSGPTAGTTTGAAGERAQSAGGAQPVRRATESSQATSPGNAPGGAKDVRITGSDVPGAHARLGFLEWRRRAKRQW